MQTGFPQQPMDEIIVTGKRPQGGIGMLDPILGLVGAGLSFIGQSKANKANIALAREQMAFQERMSSTAYQRARADMEKAGLNPVLALGKPASSPGGQTATMKNPMEHGVSSAIGYKQAATAAKLAEAQVGKTNAETAQLEGTLQANIGRANADWLKLRHQVAQITTATERMRIENEIAKITQGRFKNLDALTKQIEGALMRGEQIEFSRLVGLLSAAFTTKIFTGRGGM